MDILSLLGRSEFLFERAVARRAAESRDLVSGSRSLRVGGAGSIGQATAREIFKRDPKLLHVVDISENNMVELVRDIRSTIGYGTGTFETFSIDCGGREFEALMAGGEGYDYVLNLSALKHVRSEKDPFTLLRLIEVNILNTIKTIHLTRDKGAKRYFCVSTDKAANPVNMMGASKRIMEMFLMRESATMNISMARFANVAFSDGSLLHGFNQRFAKRQPISAPSDVRRYFITPQESGELCMMSCLFGGNRDIFFPKESEELRLTTFSDIAVRFVRSYGFEPYMCESEDEARHRAAELIAAKQWPCYFFKSDTTGEKDFEEFFTDKEALDFDRFANIGVIVNPDAHDPAKLDMFLAEIAAIRTSVTWDKRRVVELFEAMIPEFEHLDKGKYLESRM